MNDTHGNKYSFKDLEVLVCCMLDNGGLPLDSTIKVGIPEIDKVVGFGERYGVSKEKLDSLVKELDSLVESCSRIQDAGASACFVIDSLSVL